jgi:hypothetical protein
LVCDRATDLYSSPDGWRDERLLRDGGTVQIDALTPDERGRLVVCDDDGIPLASAILWLTEVGLPVQPNTWEVAFARACRRCANAGFPMQVSPHQLRHYIPIPTMSGSNITAQDSKALCDSL